MKKQKLDMITYGKMNRQVLIEMHCSDYLNFP